MPPKKNFSRWWSLGNWCDAEADADADEDAESNIIIIKTYIALYPTVCSKALYINAVHIKNAQNKLYIKEKQCKRVKS